MIALAVLGLCACNGDADGFAQGGSSDDLPEGCSPPCDGGDDTADDAGDDTDEMVDSGMDTGTDTAQDSGSELSPTGYDVGDVAYDLAGYDQNGNDWTLWGQMSNPQVVVFGNMWDDNLAFVADYLSALESMYGGSGLTSAVILLQALDATDADQSDASDYADAYGLDMAVWGADTSAWALVTPKVFVIDGQMSIVWTSIGITEQDDVATAIDGAL